MASFKITDILRFATDKAHIMTDWTVVRNNNRVDPIYESLNDKTNLTVLRVPLYENSGQLLTDCTGITCVVRIKTGTEWSDEFTLTPIAPGVDI